MNLFRLPASEHQWSRRTARFGRSCVALGAIVPLGFASVAVSVPTSACPPPPAGLIDPIFTPENCPRAEATMPKGTVPDRPMVMTVTVTNRGTRPITPTLRGMFAVEVARITPHGRNSAADRQAVRRQDAARRAYRQAHTPTTFDRLAAANAAVRFVRHGMDTPFQRAVTPDDLQIVTTTLPRIAPGERTTVHLRMVVRDLDVLKRTNPQMLTSWLVSTREQRFATQGVAVHLR